MKVTIKMDRNRNRNRNRNKSNYYVKYRMVFIALPIFLLCFVSLYFIYNILSSDSTELINNIILFLTFIAIFVLSFLGLYFLFFVKDTQVKSENIPSVIPMNVPSRYNSIDKSSSIINMKKTQNRIANTTFIDHLSYEIRTPMNGIFGNTKLLKETELSTEQQNLVHIIEHSYENLDAILSKISLGISSNNYKFNVDNNIFNIVQLIESTVETFSITADEKNIVLGLYVDPLIPSTLYGDSIKLSQVITNLVDNALATSSEYTTVNIQLDKKDISSDEVGIRFTVSDLGYEFSADELERIKNLLKTESNLDKTPIQDTKNLIISNTIIKKMGGKLDLKSKKNYGSSFFFELGFKEDIKESKDKIKPVFEDFVVGLALPSLDINRIIDDNLKKYIEYLGGKFIVYDYDSLFNDDTIALPDLMFMYHNYARHEGELEAFVSLPCQTVLITSGTLRSKINHDKHFFSCVVYAPITMSKILRTVLEKKPKNTVTCGEALNTNREKETCIKALVVEDNVISQNIIANILKHMNIDVKVATDGKRAYELRKENIFDIIFMDINMPVMDGFESTSHILSYERTTKSKHVPIVALATDTTGKEKYIKAGMDNLISKPIESEKIYDMVQYYCIDKIMNDTHKS